MIDFFIATRHNFLAALAIHFGVFLLFLPFNLIMVRKHLHEDDLGDEGSFQLSTKDCVIISLVWELCVIGLMWYSFFAVMRWIGRIFTPRKKIVPKRINKEGAK